MAKPQTIFRNASPTAGNFTTLDNRLLRCPGLSPEVRGFIATLLTCKADWEFNAVWAEREFGIGETKLKRIISDSKAAGFMKVERERDANGRYTGRTIYMFSDVPGVFPEAGKPISGKTPLTGDEGGETKSGKIPPVENPTRGKTTPHNKEQPSLVRTEEPRKESDAYASASTREGAQSSAEPKDASYSPPKAKKPAKQPAQAKLPMVIDAAPSARSADFRFLMQVPERAFAFVQNGWGGDPDKPMKLTIDEVAAKETLHRKCHAIAQRMPGVAQSVFGSYATEVLGDMVTMVQTGEGMGTPGAKAAAGYFGTTLERRVHQHLRGEAKSANPARRGPRKSIDELMDEAFPA